MDEVIDAQPIEETPAPSITASEAEEVLKREKQERVQACGKAIEATLNEHKCNLVGIPVYTQTASGFITTMTYRIDPK